MIMEVWPFLISRNPVFDYRTVVAPEFMVEKKITSLLAKTASGDVREPNCVFYREISHPKTGNISLAFRTVKATQRHLGLDEDEPLEDHPFKRAITLTEGFVVKGYISPHKLLITEQDVALVHTQMEEHFRAFWQETIRTPSVKSSGMFELLIPDNVENPLPVHVIAAYIVPEANPVPVAPTRETIPEESVALSMLSAPDKSVEALKRADGFYIKGDYRSALKQFDKVLQFNPDNVVALCGRGEILYYMKKYIEAEYAFKQAIRCDPRCARAYNGLGILAPNRENALYFYDKAIESDRDYPLAYTNKRLALKKLGRLKEAEYLETQALQAFERCDQSIALWHYFKSLFLEDLQRFDESKKELRKAQELSK